MKVFLATGTNYPDALGAANKAAEDKVLLTRPDSLPSVVANAIKTLKPTSVIILGGTSTVTVKVENAVKALGFPVTRVAGADRYETTAKVALLQPSVNEKWTVQIIFIPSIDAIHPVSGQRIVTNLTSDGYTRNLSMLQGMAQHLNTRSGGDHFESVIDELDTPLRTVTQHGDSAWVSYDDVKHLIRPEASAILVSYDNDQDEKSLGFNGYGGLGYYVHNLAFGSVPAWDGGQMYILDMWGLDPYVHELLHGLCGHFVANGIPMPELHNNTAYGYVDERYLPYWYDDILQGKVLYRSGNELTANSPIPKDGQLIGCTTEAWAIRPPRYSDLTNP